MAYEFTDFEYEPETQASSGHGGQPPSLWTAAGVLDPPVPPKRPPGPIPLLLTPRVLRIIATVLLAGIGALVLFELFILLHGR
jgi:hypothetical protein